MLTIEVLEPLTYCPNFIGVFPLDKLPEIQPNISLIVNTDIAVEPGSHWVSIFVTRDVVYIFDSFGRSIDNFDDRFRYFVNKFCREYKMYTDSKLLQNPFSNTCGRWCIFYLLCKTCGVNFFRYFSVNLHFNEKILESIFEYLRLE